ncbi:MAG: hypothetical protein IIX36_00435 [Clostridia bacterium]|nr:hypothetical protein [Clostridia bacterium]
MKLRKAISFLLTVILVTGLVTVSCFAGDESRESVMGFEYGVGPETEGYAIDYRYYSPVKENDTTRYPLVVWLHGMGDGAYDGKQVERSDISLWTSADYQSRFKESGGAFIFAARSVEEKGLYWDDCLIYPLRAAIDDFIAENKTNIDLSRIYVGGYSMGGKMTLKMAVAYPELFAAAFPICPAWVPGTAATSKLADMPVWLTSGTADPLVNYFAWVMTTWKNIVAESDVPGSCRFSTLSVVTYPDGLPTSSAHHAWFAVNNDMFSSKNGDYPFMKTFDGNGDKVKLTYPDGMISWLSGFTSDYDGLAATDSGNAEAMAAGEFFNGLATVMAFFRNFFEYITTMLF